MLVGPGARDRYVGEMLTVLSSKLFMLALCTTCFCMQTLMGHVLISGDCNELQVGKRWACE